MVPEVASVISLSLMARAEGLDSGKLGDNLGGWRPYVEEGSPLFCQPFAAFVLLSPLHVASCNNFITAPLLPSLHHL